MKTDSRYYNSIVNEKTVKEHVYAESYSII